jgi:glycosyltransferase involved in cell wall biosynthesis
MNYPKISIVTSSFNQGDYLEETILSVLGQNYPNLEYIIIDGGSTDNSVDIIRKHENQLAYWTSERDRGLYDALQKGFDKATGDIMAYINSDDIYHRKSFHVVAEIFSRFTDVAWIMGLPSKIDEAGRIVSVAKYRPWSKYNYLQREYEWIQQESCFWRRRLWIQAGGKFAPALKYAGDFELWSRFFSFAQLYSLETVLGAFRTRTKDQLSVDRLGDYRAEVNAILDQRLKNLSSQEKVQLDKLWRYKNVYSKIPILRNRMRKYYQENLDYPAQIRFDRPSQSFVMA